MSLSEETITEWSLYNIALKHQNADIVIDLATKLEESVHGGDWEWWIVHHGKGIGFRVQAKRLYPVGQYKSLFKPASQMDKLISTAIQDGVVPLYCFFNFAHPHGQFNQQIASCLHSYRGPSFWGCSLAFGPHVKSANSNTLRNLRSIMFPWHLLFCNNPTAGLVGAAGDFLSYLDVPLKLREERSLPRRVTRLIEIADYNRTRKRESFLDDSFRENLEEAPGGLAGMVVFRDLR